MIRKYIVSSRSEWTEDMKSLFGDINSLHYLDDNVVVESIIRCGRAEIILDANDVDGSLFHLQFQNDYD